MKDILKYCQDTSSAIIDDMEEKVGSGVKITVEILEASELDKSGTSYNNIIHMLTERWGVIAEELKEIVVVKAQITMEGEKGKHTDVYELHPVKIEKDWYLYETISYIISAGTLAKD